MGAWIKLFDDGSRELGTDHQIECGLASWSRGRLDGILEVQLANRGILASLSVPKTNWHQFDHFIAQVQVGKVVPERLFRVVQAELKAEHKGMFLLREWNGTFIYWISVEPSTKKDSVEITEEMIGKWITLVLPEFGYPYMILAERGKFNDNK